MSNILEKIQNIKGEPNILEKLKMSNIFEKIQKVRVDLANTKLKMSGKNTFAKYDYFELDDFIKPLNELMLKYQMTAIASFSSEFASLTAVNCENPEDKYTITSPFSSAELKGCHEVQNIGAVETYQRRYLYQAMFDIAESDGLNATQGKNEQKEKQEKNTKKDCQKPFPEVEEKEKTPEEIKEQRKNEVSKVREESFPNSSAEEWKNIIQETVEPFHKLITEMTEAEYKAFMKELIKKSKV